MKKIFIYIIVNCLSLMTIAQDKLQMKSYLEGGYYSGNLSWKQNILNISVDPKTITSIYNSTGDYFKNRVYSDIGFSVEWKGISINTNFLTIIAPTTWHSFQPLQTYYTIGSDYHYKNIVFRAEHMCTHSTETYMIGGSYTKFGIRFYFINTK